MAFNLLEPNKSTSIINVHVHIMNSVLVLVEIMVSKLEIRLYHVYLPLSFGVIYVLFTVFYFASGDPVPVYRILDWAGDAGKAAGFVLGIILIAVPFYHCVVVWGFYQLRVVIFNKWNSEHSSGSQSCTIDSQSNAIESQSNATKSQNYAIDSQSNMTSL